MSNQPIYLRFFGENEGEVPRIRPRAMAEICMRVEDLYRTCGEILAAGGEFDADLFIIRNPRQGCLLITLEVGLVMGGQPAPSFLSAFLETAEASAKLLTPTAALWLILFGQKGAVDLFRRKPEIINDGIETIARSEPVNRPEFKERAMALLDAAAAAGARRVEFEIEEGEMIVLFDRGERTNSTLLARQAYGRSKALKTGAVAGAVQRTSAEVLEGTLLQRPVRIFIGQRTGTPDVVGPQVVVWASTKPVPPVGESRDFRGAILSFEERQGILVKDDIPHIFEELTEGILVVEAATDWS
ncbi:MAG: hypothetical protein EOO23_07860 [Comamonadaceae bacterium]|nr:MAG: hypothetical protein EOO23_07860 [Comamonadaceae bacterium]